MNPTPIDVAPAPAVNTPGHLADLLGIEVPNRAALAVLNDTALASGRERGIIAADILDRITPDDVTIEQHNLGATRKTRGVFLYQDGADGREQIALHFFDHTPSVWVHIDEGDAAYFDDLVGVDTMFDMVAAYYTP